MALDAWVAAAGAVGSAGRPPREDTLLRLLALAAGILLTWVLYVGIARLLVWRLTARTGRGDLPEGS